MRFPEYIFGTRKAYFIFFFGVIQLILLHFLFSPASKSEYINSTDEVTLYFADNISPAQKDLIGKFNKIYSGRIKVELLNIPLEKFSSNERKQLFVKYLRSESERIDVFAIDQVWIPRFAKWCEPLDKYFSRNEKERIVNIAKEVCFYKNQLVVVPEFIDIGVMYYREDILEKRPDYNLLKIKLANSINWDDFISLGQDYQDMKNPFYTFPADDYEGLLCSLIELFNTNSYKDIIKFDSSTIRSPIQFLSDLVNRYKISPMEVTQLQEANITKFYLQKDGIFLRGWPNTFTYYFPDVHEETKIKRLVKVPLPHKKDSKKAFVFGGWNLMLSKYSKHKKEAVEFIKFWLRESTQEEMFLKNGFLPSIRYFYDREDLVKKFDLRFYKKLFPDAVIRPKSENYTTYSNVISHYAKAVIKQDIHIDQAILRAGTELKYIYIDNR